MVRRVLVMSALAAIVVTGAMAPATGSTDSTRWPYETGRALGAIAIAADGSSLYAVEFDAFGSGKDGEAILAKHGSTTTLWPMSGVRDVALSPAGVLLALVGDELATVSAAGVISDSTPGFGAADDVAVAPDGAVYVSTGEGGVRVFDGSLTEGTALGSGLPGVPGALTTDASGRLYVAWTYPSGDQRIEIFAENTHVASVELDYTEPIVDIAATPAGLLAIATVEDVVVADQAGAGIATLQSGEWGLDRQPGGMAIDGCGSIYVAETTEPDTQSGINKTLTERDPGCYLDALASAFVDDIAWLGEAGLTRGCHPASGGDLFCPNRSVTRGELAAFLVRWQVTSDDGGRDWFVDDTGSIFEDDINRLAAARITLGCNPPANDHFCPTNVVSRGQMAALMHRASG